MYILLHESEVTYRDTASFVSQPTLDIKEFRPKKNTLISEFRIEKGKNEKEALFPFLDVIKLIIIYFEFRAYHFFLIFGQGENFANFEKLNIIFD